MSVATIAQGKVECNYHLTSVINPQNHTRQGVLLKINNIPPRSFDQLTCYYTFCTHTGAKSVIGVVWLKRVQLCGISHFTHYNKFMGTFNNNNNWRASEHL